MSSFSAPFPVLPLLLTEELDTAPAPRPTPFSVQQQQQDCRFDGELEGDARDPSRRRPLVASEELFVYHHVSEHGSRLAAGQEPRPTSRLAVEDQVVHVDWHALSLILYGLIHAHFNRHSTDIFCRILEFCALECRWLRGQLAQSTEAVRTGNSTEATRPILWRTAEMLPGPPLHFVRN